MTNNGRKALTVLAVAIMLASVIVSAYAVITVDRTRQTVFTGYTIGINSYMNPVFDITVDELEDAGYTYGDTFDVTVQDKTIHSAILSYAFMGTFIFDTYLNVDDDGYLAAGTMWDAVLPVELGDEVTVKYTGHYSPYDKLDKFLVPLSNDRTKFASDEVFANFNEVTGGDIESGKLYRSFSPYTGTPRASYVNGLAEIYDVGYDVCLSSKGTKIGSDITKYGITGRCVDLYDAGQYTADNITYHYFIEPTKTKARLVDMANYTGDGAYLIHCNVGRDRTGFFCTLLQALCGADEDTMKATAAQAYVNLYGVEIGSEEYKVIVSSTYCRNMYYIWHYDEAATLTYESLPIDWTTKDLTGVDTKTAATNYCLNYLGIDQATLAQLIGNLCGLS